MISWRIERLISWEHCSWGLLEHWSSHFTGVLGNWRCTEKLSWVPSLVTLLKWLDLYKHINTSKIFYIFLLFSVIISEHKARRFHVIFHSKTFFFQFLKSNWGKDPDRIWYGGGSGRDAGWLTWGENRSKPATAGCDGSCL